MVLESVVSSVLNQILSAYVENFNPNQLNVGIWGGDIKLKNLKLKRGALDKFRLPIDVVEGSIGSLVLTVPWTALGSRPVKAAIDNIYLLAVPSSENKFDPEDDERRKQATKMEKLKNSELLLSSTAGTPGNTSIEEAEKNESFVAAMTNKILDNLQLRIKNVHVRYEDKISVSGHPFSIGLTVAELSAVSTDENFRESFIVGSKAGVHKLTSLDSLAIYFNTDSISLSHLAPEQFQKRFTEMISRSENSDSEASTLPDHQYILKPVSGEGKLVLRKHPTKDLAKINYQLTLSELAFLIDADQYRDALSCLDLFHFYTRRREFLRFHPGDPSVTENKARALWSFAIAATKHEVHQRAYKWTWDCFRQRRDDRKLYISLFQAAQLGTLALDSTELDDLEKRLSYQDIRYYRSLARSEMRQQRITAKHQQTNSNDAKSTSWLGWIWGGSKGPSDQEDPNFQSDSVLNEEDKRKLYEAIEWDEKEATSSAIDLPRDAIMMNIQTKLKRGSFTLRSGKLSISSDDRSAHDIISLVFDGFSADALQRTDNMELGLSLVGFRVYDGTIKNSKHPQIVRVKERQSKPLQASHQSQSELKEQSASRDHHDFFTADDPFFYLKLEHKPLDERADNAVILTMKHMEIIYHPGYVEDVVNFFQPPASQLESVGALINVASETLEGIRQDTRAGFVFALQTHKTVDIKVDINAPIIIIPQDVTLHDCQHIILDAGHISVFSNLVPPEHLKSIKFKQNRRYSDVDFMQLESMMYDQFRVELKDTQLLLGKSLEQCLSALDEPKGYAEIHLIERISLSFNVFNCIVDNTPSLTRFKVQGDLPQLRVNFSDNKYRILMSMIEVALPRFTSSQGSAGHASLNKLENFPADPNNVPSKSTQSKKAGFGMSSFFLDDSSSSFDLSDDAQGNESIQQTTNTAQEDEFFEVPELLQEEQSLNFRRNNFQLQFTVGKLILSISKSNKETGEDQKLVDSVLEGFFFCLTLRDFDMSVEITLSSMYISDGLIQRNNTTHPAFKNLVSSEILEGSSDDKNDLVKFKFTQVQANYPEFMLAYEGISKIVDADLSTINISVTRPTILELFDWIISTFTNSSTSAQATEVIPPTAEAAFQAVSPQHDMSSDKMRVKVKMRTIVFLLNDDGARIATLSLNSADFSILFNGSTMRVKARLGNLTVHDDTAQTQHAKFRSLVEIQGDDLADLQYETFSRDGCVTYPGYDSMVYLRSGSIQFTLVEDTCHRILVFFSKFAQMKAVMDTARQAARQQASGFTQTTSKIHYDVLIRTPIIIFPLHKASTDCLIAHLGEISASNAFASDENKLVTKAKAGIHNIRLTSEMHHEGQLQTLQLLVDVNIDVRLASFNKEQQNQDSDQGLDTDIVAQMSDVKINLTQPQYFALMSLVTSVPKIFDFSELNQESLSHTSSPGLIQVTAASATTDLIPEIAPVAKTADGEVVSLWTTMELAFTVTNVTLELFDAMIAATETTRNNSIAKFSLNGIRVNWKFQSDRSMASEIPFKAFRTIDTGTWKTTKFREIIPVADHDGDQLVLSYNQSAANSNVMLELNSPNVILSLDFLFSITAFFTQPHSQSSDLQRTRASHQRTSKSTLQDDQLVSNFSYRIDILNPKLTLISDPEKSDSDAVYLIIEKILVAQQKALIAAISHMNMSFGTMNDRQSSAHTTPLVLKLSYRDFLLIYSVYCKALDFSHAPHQGKNQKDSRPTTPKTISESLSISSTSQPTAATNITTYSQKLSLKLNAYDWSDQLSLDTSIILAINYYNLTNSHWEPLMEAWPIAFRISCLGCPSYHSVALESKRRLEMNITATFIDLIMTGADIWGREGENVLHQKRGMVSPYLIKNLTGYPLKVSAESEDEFRKGKEYLVEDGKSIPWRFEDWKLMRESVMSPTQSKL
ncbi:hypothetical protein O181_009026, partial [Austropuccinia psidii MF-1]|nr:hypothetical protein [Austropuccinia psidii MF-1]